MLVSFLRDNRDIFAWKPVDMPGVPRNLIEHSLNIDPKATPKRQHLRRFADDRRDAIMKEFAKLLAASFIGEVFHLEWLANPVLVRKKNSNEWRMCVNYTDLNNHCPKDPFGLPRIDQVIDSTAGCDLLCFLDCYSRYHRIAIKEEDYWGDSKSRISYTKNKRVFSVARVFMQKAQRRNPRSSRIHFHLSNSVFRPIPFVARGAAK
jgi:hypothetical protein